MKNKCFMVGCKGLIEFQAKMLVQHESRKCWQTWKVCKFHKDEIEKGKSIFEEEKPIIDFFNKETWIYWTIYKSKGIERPVIQIGEIKPYQIPVM